MGLSPRRASRLVAVALLALQLAVLLWNAHSYPSYGGYDEAEHQAYATLLIHHWQIPARGSSVSEYYTPPGFYLLAGLALRLGEHFQPANPVAYVHYENALFAFATAVLVLVLARIVFPGRRLAQLAALGFFAFLPVVFKTTAMFHPEPLSMLVATGALTLAAYVLSRRDFRLRWAVALGLLLGAAQLVRAFTLWTFAAVVLGFAGAAIARAAPPRVVLRALAVVVAVTAVVTAPWYVRQAVKYGNPVFGETSTAASLPFFERRAQPFYTALGLPQVFSDPIRPNFVNDALPTTYSEVWGDYFGAFAWGAPTPPDPKTKTQLTRQAFLGLLPTALALTGAAALLVLALRRRVWSSRPELVPAALLPGLGLLGYWFFTVSYPTPDGDVLKATYMLLAAPAWALAFAFAVDRVARVNRLLGAALVLALLVSGALMLPFDAFHEPLPFL